MTHTLPDFIEIVGWYYEHEKSAKTEARVFNDNHFGRHARHKYALKLLIYSLKVI